MLSFKRPKPEPPADYGPALAAIAVGVEAAHREAEHACTQSRTATEALAALADALDRLAERAARIDGRLERLELYLLATDPLYPVTQAELPPRDLEQKRARLEAALNGADDAGRE